MGHLHLFHALDDGVWLWRRFLCGWARRNRQPGGLQSAAEHGVGGSSVGAAVFSRRDCGDDSVQGSEGSEEDSEDENGSNSDGSHSDDGFHSSAGRVHPEAGNINGSAG